jgi:hypothetical protein
MGLATEDHTTLLLTCFVKLDQHDQHGKLKEFINAKDRVIDFDVEIAIKVSLAECRIVTFLNFSLGRDVVARVSWVVYPLSRCRCNYCVHNNKNMLLGMSTSKQR